MLTIVSSLHTISVFLCYMLSTCTAVTAKYKPGVFQSGLIFINLLLAGFRIKEGLVLKVLV